MDNDTVYALKHVYLHGRVTAIKIKSQRLLWKRKQLSQERSTRYSVSLPPPPSLPLVVLHLK